MSKYRFNPLNKLGFDTGILETDPLVSFQNEIRVKKNPGYGEFSTITDALASISGSSDTNRFVIYVAPGIYVEPLLDFSTKPYVSLVGESIQSVVIKPDDPFHHIMKLGVYNEVSFIWLEDAGLGYAGIAVEDSGIYAQCHKVTFNNCDTGILVYSNTQETQFFGEYIDMNGAFTYACKVMSLAGETAYVNLENFYVYPDGNILNPYGGYVTGTGAQLYINSCAMLSTGAIAAGYGVYVEDGAFFNAKDTLLDSFEKGVFVGNVGAAPQTYMSAVAIQNSTINDLLISHPGTMGVFSGVASHSLITNDSSTFGWDFLDIVDGELDITNKISVTFPGGIHTDLSTLAFEGAGMGLFEGGELSVVGALDVTINGGFGYLDYLGIVRRVDWVTQTPSSLPTDTDNFIFVDYTGTIQSSPTVPATEEVIFLGRVKTDSTQIEFIDQIPTVGHHMGSKLSRFNRTAIGSLFQSGSTVSEGSALTLDVTSGIYWRSENRFAPVGGTGITLNQYQHNGSSAWEVSTVSTVDVSNYNNGTTLTPLTSGYYTKHALYLVGDGANEKYFLVLGQAEYLTLPLSQEGPIPTAPDYFNRGVVLIALIYIQKSGTNIELIEDARPVIGFKPVSVAGTSDHSALTNLSSDDHIQYLLVNGSRNMSGDLNLGTNSIVNVNLVDGVDVSAHASRHLPNGADPITTSAPTTNLGGSSTNAVGIQNSLSRSDHSHAIDTAGAGTTGLLTSTDWNTFNNKLTANVAITGATKTKITYDTKGLVTSGADATTADIADSTNKRYVTDAQLVVLGNTSNTNTGDQTSIVGITGTKAQFDTACTDGNFLYVGDVTQYTDENAQDAVGAMVDTTLVYVDATPLLTRAALTGDVTASQGSNATTIAANAVTNAKAAQMATQTFKGRTTAGTGNPEDLTVAQAKTMLSLTGTNSGDQTITLTGDVTGSGTGSFAATIANDAVTFAKMQNVSTGILLGRSTAATGDVEELTVGTGLSLSAGVLTTNLGLTSVNAAGNITTTSATDVAVTSITLTPGAGTYLVMFSCDVQHDTNAGVVTFSIYANGVQATNSARSHTRGNQTMRTSGYTQAVVTVAGGQAIDARWNRGGSGTGTMGNRSLVLIKQ